MTAKFDKAVKLLRKLCNFLPRRSLLAVYKSFIRPQLDYGDVLLKLLTILFSLI